MGRKQLVNLYNKEWRENESNKDVYGLIDRFDCAVNFIEKYVKLEYGHIEAGFNMSLALYNIM